MWVVGVNPHSSLQVVVFSLCSHMEERERRGEKENSGLSSSTNKDTNPITVHGPS